MGGESVSGWFGLEFVDPAREREFRATYISENLPVIRRMLVLGAAIYSLFGILDLTVARDSWEQLWTLRFALVCPLLLAATLLLTRRPWRRFMQQIVAFVVAVAGLGIVVMIGLTEPPVCYLYYVGLILVMMFGYSVSRLCFVAASAAGLVTVAGYEVAAFVMEKTPVEFLVSNNFFLLGANLLGMIACYTAEVRERHSFSQLKTIEQDKQTLARLNRTLQEVSIRDPLTNLYNRRYLDTRLKEAINQHRRYGVETSLVLIDLDGFKNINDRFGHAAGDELLSVVAHLIETHVRETDVAFRYGGDEFCVMLPNADLDAACRTGDAILRVLRSLSLPGVFNDLAVGFSAGCAVVGNETERPETLLRAADDLMYEAKRRGKGRVLARNDSLERQA